MFYLGSVGRESSAGSYEIYMDSKPDISMHSHPNVMPTEIEELFSMGIRIKDKGLAQRWINNDWDNVVKGKTAPIVYIYFPTSGYKYALSKKGYKREIVK